MDEAELDKLKRELTRLTEENAMLRRGGEQLGKIIERQGREAIELTNSQDIIDEDGDGDWEVVWERLHDMKRANADLNAEVTSLRRASIRALQTRVNDWVTRNFDNSELSAVVGMVEEVGELCRAVVKMEQGIRGSREEWFAEIRKEAGDVFIKLCDIARFYEFDLSDAIQERWAKVSQRDWKADPIGHGIDGAA